MRHDNGRDKEVSDLLGHNQYGANIIWIPELLTWNPCMESSNSVLSQHNYGTSQLNQKISPNPRKTTKSW